MNIFTCEYKPCSIEFKKALSGKRPIRFCSFKCYNDWRKGKIPPGGFAIGSAPWNKGMKGLRVSPETEFKKGQKSINHLPIGSIQTRYRNRSNKSRAFIKVAEPNIWVTLARHNWEKANGKIPSGMIIHHKDRDTLNDSLQNLELVSRAQHLLEHRAEFESRRKRRASAAQRKRWRNYRKQKRVRGVCACGTIADVGMPIYQLRPSGTRFRNHLLLCLDCYGQELELNQAL